MIFFNLWNPWRKLWLLLQLVFKLLSAICKLDHVTTKVDMILIDLCISWYPADIFVFKNKSESETIKNIYIAKNTTYTKQQFSHKDHMLQL